MLYRRRVQFYDTDAQGIVHHSNYFRYFEEARGEFLRELGLPYSEVRKQGYEVVLLEACCNFKKPLYYDEVVEIELLLEEMDRFTFTFVYNVVVGDDLRAEGRTKHCMVRNGRIVSIPGRVREKLSAELKT
ncbi:acyl-CoA thioesterase [Hydrogenivirga sp.]